MNKIEFSSSKLGLHLSAEGQVALIIGAGIIVTLMIISLRYFFASKSQR